MLAVFYLTFNVIGAGLQWLLEQGIGALTALTDKALTAAGVNEVLHGLVIDLSLIHIYMWIRDRQ